MVLLVIAQAALWVLARPAAGLSASYVGQGLGALSVLLLSIALVLISTLTVVELSTGAEAFATVVLGTPAAPPWVSTTGDNPESRCPTRLA